ncbi:unnamed protein product (mitochondrion) [Plasmodiophora brassicae]|uniref:3'-5' exonuclease domain-containing protein n=1 Tax=Plasmodiophora brassicae TaxID=37360 RepID=A0A3P3Y2D1_PLABS|nr:unnamed protein product [Plasmodiophora brassicae]
MGGRGGYRPGAGRKPGSRNKSSKSLSQQEPKQPSIAAYFRRGPSDTAVEVPREQSQRDVAGGGMIGNTTSIPVEPPLAPPTGALVPQPPLVFGLTSSHPETSPSTSIRPTMSEPVDLSRPNPAECVPNPVDRERDVADPPENNPAPRQLRNALRHGQSIAALQAALAPVLIGRQRSSSTSSLSSTTASMPDFSDVAAATTDPPPLLTKGTDWLERQLQRFAKPAIVSNGDDGVDDDDAFDRLTSNGSHVDNSDMDDDVDDDPDSHPNEKSSPTGVSHGNKGKKGDAASPVMRKVLDGILENVKSVDSSILALVRSGQLWVRFGSAAVRQLLVGDLDPNRFYVYDVFVWDPETMASDIPIHCPHCRQRRSARQAKPGDYNVVHHSWTAGRRVVTRDSCYFIIARTYRCTRCKGSKAPSYTFSAYHENFLSQLPDFIRVQFPALLTHRSAIDNSIIEEMRSLTEQGVSIEGYHRMLMEWHTSRYTRLQIQWFGSLLHCKRGIGYRFTRELGDSPPQFSSFADPDRYNGFVPSPSYLKYCLVKFHRQVRPLMDLLIQTVSGRILKLDHSFKIPKLIRRFNGEKLVEALFTCCNEFEEPVLQMLTFGASLAELLPALRGFMKRILKNGLTEPSLFVSDRCCQDASLFVEFKHFLRALSLGKALCSNLAAILRSIRENLFLELPIVVHRSLVEIEVVALGAVRIAAQRCLLESIENEDVDIDDTTCERLFDGVIESVTRATNVCAQRILEESSRSSQTVDFAAAVASFVSAVTGATDQLVSLRSISARQRGRDLADSAVPSFSWPPSDGRVLSTPSEINDVVDAVYRTLLSEAPDKRVIGYDQEWDVVMTRLGGRFVSSRSRVRTIQIAMSNGEMYLVRVTDAMKQLPRAVVTLLADARIAKVGRQIQHDAAKLLKDFGVHLNNCVDVAVLGKRRGKLSTSKLSLERLMSLVFHVSLEKPPHIRVSEHWSGPLSRAQIRYANRDAFAGLALYHYFTQFQDCSTPIPLTDAAPGLRVDIVIGNSKRVASGTIVENSGTSRDVTASQHVLLVEVDELSAPGLRIATRNGLPSFQTIKELPVRLPVRLQSIRRARQCLPLESQSDDVVVLKDIFHWLNDLPVKATNAYQPAFLAAMRDAILVVDPEDKDMVRRKLEEAGQLPDDFEAFIHNSRWARSRIKRATRRPVEMDEAVQAVVDAYRSAKDPMTNDPLLTEAGLKKIEAMRVHVRKGCLSDPPGFQFYTEIAVDELGLPVYHCSRGTNSLEGGYHRDLYRSMGSFGASLELADAILAEKRHRQLMRASVRHRADVPFFGHYDVWNIERVQELALSVSSRLVLINRTDAENGPQSTRPLTGCYAFAAKRFGMAIPIMPMHLPEEFKLFDEAMRQFGKDFAAIVEITSVTWRRGIGVSARRFGGWPTARRRPSLMDASIIAKLGHALPEIRARALDNVISKLRSGIVSREALVSAGGADLLRNLLSWFDHDEVPRPVELLRLLAELATHAPTAQQFVRLDALRIAHIIKLDAAQPAIQTALDDFIKVLSAHLPDHIPPAPIVDPISSRNPPSYHAEAPPHEKNGSTPPAQRAATSSSSFAPIRPRQPVHLTELGVDSDDDGWRFPMVALVRHDERILFDLGLRLRSRDRSIVVEALHTLHNDVLLDFPGEVILQRPQVLAAIVDLICSGFDLHVPVAAVLSRMVHSLFASLRMLADPSSRPPPTPAPVVSLQDDEFVVEEFQYPPRGTISAPSGDRRRTYRESLVLRSNVSINAFARHVIDTIIAVLKSIDTVFVYAPMIRKLIQFLPSVSPSRFDALASALLFHVDSDDQRSADCVLVLSYLVVEMAGADPLPDFTNDVLGRLLCSEAFGSRHPSLRERIFRTLSRSGHKSSKDFALSRAIISSLEGFESTSPDAIRGALDGVAYFPDLLPAVVRALLEYPDDDSLIVHALQHRQASVRLRVLKGVALERVAASEDILRCIIVFVLSDEDPDVANAARDLLLDAVQFAPAQWKPKLGPFSSLLGLYSTIEEAGSSAAALAAIVHDDSFRGSIEEHFHNLRLLFHTDSSVRRSAITFFSGLCDHICRRHMHMDASDHRIVARVLAQGDPFGIGGEVSSPVVKPTSIGAVTWKEEDVRNLIKILSNPNLELPLRASSAEQLSRIFDDPDERMRYSKNLFDLTPHLLDQLRSSLFELLINLAVYAISELPASDKRDLPGIASQFLSTNRLPNSFVGRLRLQSALNMITSYSLPEDDGDSDTARWAWRLGRTSYYATGSSASGCNNCPFGRALASLSAVCPKTKCDETFKTVLWQCSRLHALWVARRATNGDTLVIESDLRSSVSVASVLFYNCSDELKELAFDTMGLGPLLSSLWRVEQMLRYYLIAFTQNVLARSHFSKLVLSGLSERQKRVSIVKSLIAVATGVSAFTSAAGSRKPVERKAVDDHPSGSRLRIMALQALQGLAGCVDTLPILLRAGLIETAGASLRRLCRFKKMPNVQVALFRFLGCAALTPAGQARVAQVVLPDLFDIVLNAIQNPRSRLPAVMIVHNLAFLGSVKPTLLGQPRLLSILLDLIRAGDECSHLAASTLWSLVYDCQKACAMARAQLADLKCNLGDLASDHHDDDALQTRWSLLQADALLNSS